MAKQLLTQEEVGQRISDSLGGMSGKEVCNIHNGFCCGDLEYKGDSLWELTPDPLFEGDE